MASLTNFSKYYKTISNSELLHILENPDDYQPLAVEAARQEFADRQLSDTEINEARESLIAKQSEKEKQAQRVKIIENKVKNTGHTLIDTLNPIQAGPPSTDKVIRLIVVVFGGLFLYMLIRDYDALKAYAKDITSSPLVSSVALYPYIILPVAVLTFWKRKPLGWTLLALFLTFSSVVMLWTIFHILSWKPYDAAGLENLFPRPSLTAYVIPLFFFAGMLYVICRQNVREVYSINKNKMQSTIAITAIISLFLIMYIFVGGASAGRGL